MGAGVTTLIGFEGGEITIGITVGATEGAIGAWIICGAVTFTGAATVITGADDTIFGLDGSTGAEDTTGTEIVGI